MDGGGSRNKVEERRNLAVKRSGPDRVHGSDGDIVPLKGDSLNVCGRESCIDAVSELDGSGCEGRAITLDD
jgi:uncharacterized protein with PhoU and TrkA domain